MINGDTTAGENTTTAPSTNTVERTPARQVILSENPFDVLSDKAHIRHFERAILTSIEEKEDDGDAFMEFLTRGNVEVNFLKQQQKIGIYKKLEIFSKVPIPIPPKRYYRYPFDWSVKNDGSDMYKQFYGASIIAISSVYSNYRRFNEEFRMIYSGELIHFGKVIRTTSGLERILRQNDIKYKVEEGYLVVGEDIALIYDMIMNEGILEGHNLPFILSEYEFENAIVYHTRVERGPVVNTQDGIEYMYRVHGPLFSGDFNMGDGIRAVCVE
ncbi:hypothetical protein PAEPH01_0111 [Pancytospora epiphaga]|nr:hypothetical protein PAEPH01_0111 [Pancytospora epiphaga]